MAIPPRRGVRVDAHHHLWRYTAEEFGWLGQNMMPLRRDFLLPELEQTLNGAGIDATVAVQARQTLEETRFLLECAARSPRICGVVGWAPLDDENVAEVLQEFAGQPRLRGVREIAQGQPAGFLERAEFHRGIEQVTACDLTYDILIYAPQLPEATRFVDRHPRQRFVLDHAAKPPIAQGELEPWRTHMRSLAERENVLCKLSGLATEACWTGWTLDTLRPYLDACVEAFGTERLLAGSDWPVSLLATGYARWWATLEAYLQPFSSSEQERILGGNAVHAYKLEIPSQPGGEQHGREQPGIDQHGIDQHRGEWLA
jgi:L-fuconolactonase